MTPGTIPQLVCVSTLSFEKHIIKGIQKQSGNLPGRLLPPDPPGAASPRGIFLGGSAPQITSLTSLTVLTWHSLSLSLYIYIYIYVYVPLCCVCVCVCVCLCVWLWHTRTHTNTQFAIQYNLFLHCAMSGVFLDLFLLWLIKFEIQGFSVRAKIGWLDFHQTQACDLFFILSYHVFRFLWLIKYEIHYCFVRVKTGWLDFHWTHILFQ